MNEAKESLFWKGFSLFIICVMVTSIITSFYYPWQRPVFPNSDFENGDLTNWTYEGDAFANQPVFGDNPFHRGRATSNLQGNYWVGTFELRNKPGEPPGKIQGDYLTGRLTSVPFTITKNRISFLIGGGDGTASTGVGLEVEGQRVFFEPGRGKLIDSEKMSRITWDVSKWKGKKAEILIIDNSREGWGHINADDFRYT